MRALLIVALSLVALRSASPQAPPPASSPAGSWVLLSPLPSTPPSPRLGYEGACVWDSAHRVLVRYGGHNQGGGGEQGSEVWTFDPATARWRLFEPNRSPPGVCCAQENVFDPARARYVRFPAFSGSHGWQWRREILLNDSSVWTWELETSTWRDSRPLPAPRIAPLRGASWDSEHEVIVVCGGEGSAEGTLVYDPRANTWTRMRPALEPPERSGGGMAYDAARGLHILFGVQFGDDPHTWAYDLERNEWRDLRPAPMPPTFENDAVLEYDPARRIILAIVKITAGKDDDARHRLETWSYDAGENRWTRLALEREPDPSGNRARVLVHAPQLDAFLLENSTHPPQGRREQQVWMYRPAGPAPRAEPIDPPPAAPAEIRVLTADGGAVVSWSASPSAAISRYVIERGAGERPWRAKLEPVAELPASARSWRDDGIARGSVVHYAVRAVDAAGRASERGGRGSTRPRFVEDLVVSVRGTREVELAWQPPPGEADGIAGYHIERAPVEVASDGQLVRLRGRTPPLDPPSVGAVTRIGAPVRLTASPVAGTSFRDVAVDLEKPAAIGGELLHERRFDADELDARGRPCRFGVYAYRVIAVNRLGVESGPSPAVLTIPAPPEHVFAREDGTTCRLRWRPSREAGIRGYRVYRMNGRYDDAPIVRLGDEPIAATELADPGAGTETRRYHVVAVDALGQEGAPSAPVWFEREWKAFYAPFTGDWHQ